MNTHTKKKLIHAVALDDIAFLEVLEAINLPPCLPAHAHEFEAGQGSCISDTLEKIQSRTMTRQPNHTK